MIRSKWKDILKVFCQTVAVILLIIMSSPFIRKWLADMKNKRLAAKAEARVGKENA